MSLKRINLFFLLSLLVSLNAYPENEENVRELSIEDIRHSGKDHLGNSVFVKGFLLIDQGAFLYSTLDSLLKYDLTQSVFLQLGDYRPYKKFSGCFVEVEGIVGTHKTDKSEFRIKTVKSLQRTGPLYLMALDKAGEHEQDIGCELHSIVEGMILK